MKLIVPMWLRIRLLNPNYLLLRVVCLSVPETIVIPQKRTRYWGWIATPAAAAVGLLIGLFIHRPAERQDNFTVPVVVASDNSGHSIVEDGTDYSLLVSL